MKIGTAKIHNFLSFKDVEFDFENQGLALITGLNKDNNDRSNGSGKSTLIEALVWGLFGETTKRLKADEVINRDEFSDCCVTLNISEHPNEYKIERYRKHIKHKNDLRFFVNGTEKKGKTNSETQEMINDELGIDYKIFTNSILFPQESKFKFVSASDSEKKDILTDILDLGYIDEAQKKASLIIKKFELELHDATNEIKNLGNKKIEYLQELDEVEHDVSGFEREKERNIDSFVENIKDCREAMEELDVEAVKVKAQAEDFEVERKSDIRLLIQKMTNEELKKEKLVIPDVSECEKKIEKLHMKYVTIEGIKEKRRKLVSECERIEEVTIASKNKDIQRIEKRIVKIKNEIEEFKSLGSGDCPTCKQKVKKSHSAGVVEQKQKDINIEKDIIKVFEGDVGKLEEKVGALKLRVSKCNELIECEGAIEKKIKKYEKQIVGAKDIKHELELIELKIDSFVSDIKNKKEGLNPHKFDKDVYKKQVSIIELQIEALEESVEKAKKSVNPYKEMIKKIEKKITKVGEDEIRLGHDQEGKQLELSYYEFWKEGFSNQGLKSFIFDGVVNDLNDQLEDYLDEMFDGLLKVEFSMESETASGEIRQKFSTNILYSGEEVSFESLSGGEKRSISLAVDLALSNLIAQRSFKKFGLLIMDEAVDHLDFQGKERFLDLLPGLQKDTVLVVSHDETFKQKFDNIIHVEKVDGESLIV